MIEHDDAVRYVFFQPLARKRRLAMLTGDDGGYPFVFQPAEKTSYFWRPYAGLSGSGDNNRDVYDFMLFI